MENQEMFDKLCGNCAGIDIADITDEDVRDQGRYYNASKEEIDSAIDGLHEYQLD